MSSEIRDAIEKLEAIKAALDQDVPPLLMQLESGDLNENLDAYFLLNKLSDTADAIRKIFTQAESPLADRISNLVGAIGDELVREFDGRRYKVKPDLKVYVSVKAENKPRMLEWFKADPNGRELVKEDIHNKTMESFIIAKIEAGETIPTDIFGVFPKKTLTIRKLPEKKA